MRLHPTSDPQLVLLRHGETDWSASGRHTGRTDRPLLPIGEARARAAGQALSEYQFAAVYCSPLVRAKETARLAGVADPIIDADLLEWDYGPIEGRTPKEISVQLGREFQIFDDGVHVFDEQSDAAPGGQANQGLPYRHGEQLTEVATRAARFIARVEPALESGQDVLVIAHGHLLRVLAAVWLGLDPKWAARFELETAAISMLGYGHHRRTIEGWNLPSGD